MSKWTNKVLAAGSEGESIATRALVRGTETPEMARLGAGFLIREMLDRFKKKIASVLMPDRSIWMYSTHDTTIPHILNSLGLFDVI